MARGARAYRGAKRQKERVRQARQEEKRRRRFERRHTPQPTEDREPESGDIPSPPPHEPPET